MQKVNKFKVVIGVVLGAAFFLVGFVQNKISPRLQQKLNAAVQTTFEVENFDLLVMPVSGTVNTKTPVELGSENLFEVKKNDSLIGYIYLGRAPSMKNVFDYVVLFNPDLSIKKSKVLIYREDYGRQIGSQRWLKQFIGKKSGDHLTYGEDVDAISGATISAKSMTKATNEVLESFAILHAEKVL
ncbi:FMN-binding protein [uncultured Croceitalea sp.]|uniref:FMN-binding protein n=1 Tax=uncultured Croceitalea sp. TaxID=1798908 RepID=UPI00330568DA